MLDTLERFRKEHMQLAKVLTAYYNADVYVYIYIFRATIFRMKNEDLRSAQISTIIL